MARLPLSMLRRYAREPGLAVRHGKAATVLLSRPGGVAALRGRLANLTANDSAAQAAAATAAVLAARFRQADIVARRQPAAVIRLLAPYTSDRAGIADPRLTAQDRLRRLRRAILTETGLFDPVHYAACTPEAAGSDPLEHYLDHGLGRGARINAWFDPREYVGAHEDVAASGLDPVLHYALLGWQEGRHPGSWFDPSHYAAQEPAALDVMPDLGFASPLVHFVRYGVSAGHEARPRRGILGTDGHMATMVSDLPRKGVILIVSHDAEVGGAQHLCRTFATWLATHTRWEPRFVTMKGGNLAHTFASIAPTFDASAHPEDRLAARLAAFAGPDVAAVWLNSVASGDFLRHWTRDTPIVAHLHELPKMLDRHRARLDLILDRATRILGGSEAVTTALHDLYGAPAGKLDTRHAFIEGLDDDLLGLAEDKAAAKAALGLAPEAPLITACGVIHWRKSPDKFIDVASRVLARHPDASFVWIGGGTEQAQYEAQVKSAGLSDRVRFTGYSPDVKPYLAASDIFLLPSEEDPFPLVCLYAGALLNPILCFEDAGGTPELIADGGGRALPFGDVDAMADAVCGYLSDPALRAADGAAARERVLSRFTVAAAAPSLLHHLREAAGIAPDVSVVVPNYNYARYLPERLASIAGQTFQDFEVILLDDRSTDASVPILQDYADARTGTRVVVNETNSGSPFVQWLRGIEAARGDLVWIAEADDSAAPDLLAGLVTPMLDRNVMLAYAKSVPVGSDGAVLGDYEPLFLDRINTGRWSHSYLSTDHEEVDAGLGIANCIPNASSVLFRRFLPEPDFAAMLTGMRMCGDWLFYLRAVRGGMVGFDAAPRNLHRRHDGTVTAATEGSPLYFDEIAQVRDYVARTYSLGKRAQAKIVDFTRQDIDRFSITDPARIARIEAEAVPQPADARHPCRIWDRVAGRCSPSASPTN